MLLCGCCTAQYAYHSSSPYGPWAPVSVATPAGVTLPPGDIWYGAHCTGNNQSAEKSPLSCGGNNPSPYFVTHETATATGYPVRHRTVVNQLPTSLSAETLHVSQSALLTARWSHRSRAPSSSRPRGRRTRAMTENDHALVAASPSASARTGPQPATSIRSRCSTCRTRMSGKTIALSTHRANGTRKASGRRGVTKTLSSTSTAASSAGGVHQTPKCLFCYSCWFKHAS
jgi:hypothetical protein